MAAPQNAEGERAAGERWKAAADAAQRARPNNTLPAILTGLTREGQPYNVTGTYMFVHPLSLNVDKKTRKVAISELLDFGQINPPGQFRIFPINSLINFSVGVVRVSHSFMFLYNARVVMAVSMLLVAVEVPAGPVLSINIVDNIPASLPHFEHYGLELRNARHVLILRGGMTKEADEVTSKAAEHNFFEDLIFCI